MFHETGFIYFSAPESQQRLPRSFDHHPSHESRPGQCKVSPTPQQKPNERGRQRMSLFATPPTSLGNLFCFTYIHTHARMHTHTWYCCPVGQGRNKACTLWGRVRYNGWLWTWRDQKIVVDRVASARALVFFFSQSNSFGEKAQAINDNLYRKDSNWELSPRDSIAGRFV